MILLKEQGENLFSGRRRDFFSEGEEDTSSQEGENTSHTGRRYFSHGAKVLLRGAKIPTSTLTKPKNDLISEF